MRTNYHLLVQPHLCDILEWKRRCYNLKQIALALGVPYSTFRYYINTRPDLRTVILGGRRNPYQEGLVDRPARDEIPVLRERIVRIGGVNPL